MGKWAGYEVMKLNFTMQIKQSPKTDEWYTPSDAVELIVPFLHKRGFRKILCPFDKASSNFVPVLRTHGFEVTHGHIDDGNDFFERDDLNEYDAVVSNPPYSKRQEVLEHLFASGVPFAMILNYNGLFDNRARWEMFKRNKFELLIPQGRIHFFNDTCAGKAPQFQSIYVCSGILDKQIEFADGGVEGK